MRPRVLVVGEPNPHNREMVRALQSHRLHVVFVRHESDLFSAMAQSNRPHAVLLLTAPGSVPDCLATCTRRGRLRQVPDCVVGCIQSSAGFEELPVLYYSTDEGFDPPPEEIAALVAVAASMSATSPPPSRRAS